MDVTVTTTWPVRRCRARCTRTSRRAGEQRRRLSAAGAIPPVDAGVLAADVRRQPSPRLCRHQGVRAVHDRSEAWQHRHRALRGGDARLPKGSRVRRHEGGRCALHHVPVRRLGAPRHPRQRHRHRPGSDPTGRLPDRLRGRRAVVGVLGTRRKSGLARGSGTGAFFLASDQSAFVTGHNIPVDGGTKAGGGWLFSPREERFVNRSRHL